MSERGSFCTEYVYCNKCFEILKKHLLGDNKYLRSITIPGWSGCSQPEDLPIIAGKIGGLHSGEEFQDFENMASEIVGLCCNVRVVVLSDTCGTSVYLLRSGGGYELQWRSRSLLEEQK